MNPPLRRLAPLLLLIAILAPLWHIHIIDRNMPQTHADLVPVWIGSRFALAGEDPYSDLATREIQRSYYGRPLRSSDHVNKMGFAYPIYIAILLAPIAHLPWSFVRRGFLIAIPLLTAASVLLWLWIAEIQISRGRAAVLVALTLGSWPVMWGVRLLQPTIVVALLIVAGCALLKRGHGTSSGLLFATAMVKPQLALPLLAWLLLWTAMQRRWSFALSFAGGLAALLLCARRLAPGWIPRWIASMADYASYTDSHPGLQLIFGRWFGIVLMAAVATTSAFVLWRLRRSPSNSNEFGFAIALALATTVALIPTDLPMIYNQILLLPACLILTYSTPNLYPQQLARRIAIGLLGWGFLTVYLAVLGESLFKASNFWDDLPCQNLLLPAALFLALALQGLVIHQGKVEAL